MNVEGDEMPVFETLRRREALLRRLAETPNRPSSLASDMESARSTIDRGLAELEAVDLIDCVDGQYRTTLAGELMLEEYDRLIDRLGTVTAARTLLSSLPADVTIDHRLLDGATVAVAGQAITDPAGESPQIDETIEPVTAFEAVLEPGTHHRAYVPSLDHPLVGSYTDAIGDGISVEVTLPNGAVERLLTDFRRSTADAMAAGELRLFETATRLPYGLVVVDFETPATDHPFGSDGTTDALAILVVCDHGEIRGLVANDRPGAIEWATARLAAVRANARELALTDGS